MHTRLRITACGFAVASLAFAGAAQSQTAPLQVRGLPGLDSRPPTRLDVPKGGVRVPLGNDGAVTVRINGSRPLRFYFDTGANLMLISAAVRDELHLSAAGKYAIGEQFHVDSASLGAVALRDFYAVVPDSPTGPAGAGFDGVIGLSLLQEVLVTLDAPASTLTVERGTLPAADGRRVLDYKPFDTDGHLVTVATDVAGRAERALIDFGSVAPMIVPTNIAPHLAMVDVVAGPRIGGPGIATADTKLAHLDGDLVIGALRVTHPLMLIADVQLAADGRKFSAINVGRPILQEMRITFDQRNKRVSFERAAGDVIDGAGIVLGGRR